MTRDFCVFVLSHERPDRVLTVPALREAGYTGPVEVVVDSDDSRLSEYRSRFGDDLTVFDKDAVEDDVDLGDSEPGRQTPLYAREKCWQIADARNLDYVLVLDDDYDWFRHRIGPRGEYLDAPPWINDMDGILDAMMSYMDRAEQVDCLAFSQGGDYIGGGASTHAAVISHRKVMNAFLLDPDRKFEYIGRLNDDVSTYVRHGHLGRILLTYMPLCLNQESTQQEAGGLTEAYLDFGTYAKSFYTVMYAPSCTTVNAMGETHHRLHHRISWNNAVPRIISEEHKK